MSLSTKRSNYPVGGIWQARMQMQPPPFIREQKRSGKRAEGIRYERKAQAEFLSRYPGYLDSPWIVFQDAEGKKWCQPDGLIVDPWKGRLVLVEFKMQHTEEAWPQMFRLYLPVLNALFGGSYDVACVEVCKWYDCATLCPVPPTLCDDPLRARPGLFNVHIWRP